MSELKQVLTTKDLKKMFNVTKTSIFNWRKLKENALQFYKVEGNGLNDPVRYRLEDVETFCKATGRQIINPIYLP